MFLKNQIHCDITLILHTTLRIFLHNTTFNIVRSTPVRSSGNIGK